MRKLFILFLIVSITSLIKSQIVNIPDANFKNALLENPVGVIDTNSDGEIQVSEALAFSGLIECSSRSITNLTGIEAFVNITRLRCIYNHLTTLDVSKNTALTELNCAGNALASIDLSKNIVLQDLDCGSNYLTNLDISKNINLTRFDCANNHLINLNIKNGNNVNMAYMDAHINPDNLCIQVDNVSLANSYTTSGKWLKDTKANYNINCLLSIAENNKTEITSYPNPAKDILNFSEEVSNITISGLSGKIVKQISGSEKSINVSKLAKGSYIITATSKSGELINKKFIKE